MQVVSNLNGEDKKCGMLCALIGILMLVSTKEYKSGLGVALYTTGSTFVTQHKANMNCSQKPTNTRMRHGWIRNQNMLRFELIVLFGFGMEGWMIAQFG
ncbi:hypothetical protein HN51_005175, partial [Arachis hypogaea]